ncbi:MAG TPA: hypothetical protein VKN36_02785, partial [Eudoraea sp.]|nr:hypothetical protein [Eudoraea sp.]
SGAIAFMIVCSYLALKYDTHEVKIKSALYKVPGIAGLGGGPWYLLAQKHLKNSFSRLLRAVGLEKS